MEIFSAVDIRGMQTLHLQQMAADHRISRSLKRTACQHIEHGVLLIFLCKLFRRRKHVFLCFCDNFVDSTKALHGFFVVRIAFQLMQQLKRNAEYLCLISLRINYIARRSSWMDSAWSSAAR